MQMFMAHSVRKSQVRVRTQERKSTLSLVHTDGLRLRIQERKPTLSLAHIDRCRLTAGRMCMLKVGGAWKEMETVLLEMRTENCAVEEPQT